MATDLNRLHEVITKRESQEILPRGCGKTFAKAHEVLGLILTGHENITVILSRMSDRDYCQKMLSEIFREYGVLFKKLNPEKWRCESSNLVFRSKESIEQGRALVYTTAIVHMGLEDT